MPFAATWMDLEIVILRKIHQTESMILLIYGIQQKATNELIYKIEVV